MMGLTTTTFSSLPTATPAGAKAVVVSAASVDSTIALGGANGIAYLDGSSNLVGNITSGQVTAALGFTPANAAAAVLSFNARTGAVTPTLGDYSVGLVTGAAPLASPTFTGTPAAPTAPVNTNNTQLATTGYVDRYAAAAPQASAPTTGGTVTPTITGATTVVQINPAGTLANLTLTLPVGVLSGQTCWVAFSQAITALAVTTTNVTATNGMALPTSATANQAFGFVWSTGTTKWTRFL